MTVHCERCNAALTLNERGCHEIAGGVYLCDMCYEEWLAEP